MPEQLKFYLAPLVALIAVGAWFVLRPAPELTPEADPQGDTRTAALVQAIVKPLDPKVEGGVSKPGVIRYVGEKSTELEACYKTALKRSPGAAGRLILQIMIDGEGKVAGVHTAASQVADDEVDGCFAGVLANIEFPTPVGGAPTTVTYPFALGTKVQASVEVADPPTG